MASGSITANFTRIRVGETLTLTYRWFPPVGSTEYITVRSRFVLPGNVPGSYIETHYRAPTGQGSGSGTVDVEAYRDEPRIVRYVLDHYGINAGGVSFHIEELHHENVEWFGSPATTDSDWGNLVEFPRQTGPNTAPYWLSDPPDITVEVGETETFDYTSIIRDDENDVITYGATESSPYFSGTINSANHSGSVTGISVGTGFFTSSIHDSHGAIGATRRTTVIVIAAGDATTDSDWGSLVEFPRQEEETTDSDWGSLVEFPRQTEPNDPPVWDLPSAINVNINDDVTFNLLNYCSDPDDDPLTFTANESSSFFSINLSGSILTVNGGPDDRRPAGNISLTANDGHTTVAASVPVNVLDTSRNAAPVIITPVAPFPTVIIDGRGTGGGRVYAADQYTATDSDGDAIRTWDADPPGGWRVESEGYLTTSTTPNAHQTGFVQLSAIQDYFNRFTIFSSSLQPSAAIRHINYRVRCRDIRRAWSNYVDAEVVVLQPVHGSTHNLDTFEQRPDRRQPNIWAFKKGATTSAGLGGVHYQYTTPDAARADKINWVGSIRYAARRLYNLIQGTRPQVVIHGVRNVHSSLNAVLDDIGDVIFTVKPDAPTSDVGEYSFFFNYTSLCQVLVDGGGAGNPDYWHSVTGFLFITEDVLPVSVRILADGQDVSRLDVGIGTQIVLTWEPENATSVTLELVGGSGPVNFPLDGSFSPTFQTEGTRTYRVVATGSSGDTASDEIVIVVTDATTDSDWGDLVEFPRSVGLPTVNIDIDRDTAEVGQSYRVTWSSSGATNVLVRWRIGIGNWTDHSTNPNGFQDYTVGSDWTAGVREWEIRGTNSAGTATDSDTIEIIVPRGAVDIYSTNPSSQADFTVDANQRVDFEVRWSEFAVGDDLLVLEDGTEFIDFVATSGTSDPQTRSFSRTYSGSTHNFLAIIARNGPTIESDSIRVTWETSTEGNIDVTSRNHSPEDGPVVLFVSQIVNLDVDASRLTPGDIIRFYRGSSRLWSETATRSDFYRATDQTRSSAGTYDYRAEIIRSGTVVDSDTIRVTWSAAEYRMISWIDNRDNPQAVGPIEDRDGIYFVGPQVPTGTLVSYSYRTVGPNIPDRPTWRTIVYLDGEVIRDVIHQALGGTTSNIVFPAPTTPETHDLRIRVDGLSYDRTYTIEWIEVTDAGEWADIISNPTRAGEWADIITSPTVQGPWGAIYGPPVRDGAWSDVVFLLSPFATVGSPWADIINNPTEAGEWGAIYGPPIFDGGWSDTVFVDAGVGEDGEWSMLSPPAYRPRPSSAAMVIYSGEWSPLSAPAYQHRPGDTMQVVLSGPWSVLSNTAYPIRPGDAEQVIADGSPSPLGLPAYRPRPGITAIVVYNGPWSALSRPAYRPRAGTDEPVASNGEWSALSLPSYRPRPGTDTSVIHSSRWNPLSAPAYHPRTGPDEQVILNLWSSLGTSTYRPRVGPPELVVYHGPWSPLSNVAQRERVVLSAIGGAEPFIHIYEARRGWVTVNSLSVGADSYGAFTNSFNPSTAAGDLTDLAIINPDVRLEQMQREGARFTLYRNGNRTTPNAKPFRIMLALPDPISGLQRFFEAPILNTNFDTTWSQARVRWSNVNGLVVEYLDDTLAGVTVMVDVPTELDTPDTRVAVLALLPQHDDNQLSRIQWRFLRVNDWYYYHGIPEIYVSDPLEVVASEDAYSYSGRDSANLQSPPHVGHASAVVRQHQSADRPWFEELMNRGHVITGQRVHFLLRDQDGNYGKDFTGIMYSPPLQHADNIYDWRITCNDPTTLMVESFANSTILRGPSTTVGEAIELVYQAYADRVAGLTRDDVLDPTFNPDHFPVPLAWFWTDYDSERNIVQRLVNTQGPPTSYYVNQLGRAVFTGCEDRAEPIRIGMNRNSADIIPIVQTVSFSDHVVDVVNDARIPVSLHGWILPENLEAAETAAHIYEKPETWGGNLADRVAVQLFENYQSNALFNLARGTAGVAFGEDGTYRYRIRTDSPVAPATGDDHFVLSPDTLIEGTDYTIDHVAANLIEVVMLGAPTTPVPDFQLLGAQLKHFRTIEAWASEEVLNENDTRFSHYLYHYRLFTYGGYTSISLSDAQLLADWVVRYYRKGIKTITLTLFCTNHVQQALKLWPDRTPVEIVGKPYGDDMPDRWLVRTRRRVYRDGHMWVEVTLDEDVMHSLGVEHSPLCEAYSPPAFTQAVNYTADNDGMLQYESTSGGDVDGQALIIPHVPEVTATPDLAATVFPIATANESAGDIRTQGDPDDGVVWATAAAGEFIGAHYNLRQLEALDDAIFWKPGLRAQSISAWLVNKGSSGQYWGMFSTTLYAPPNSQRDNEIMPAMYHFLRLRYSAGGVHQDVVMSFVTPRTTIHAGHQHWINVVQEQPWLDDDDAGEALGLSGFVTLLDWQAYPQAPPTGARLGVQQIEDYYNNALVSRNPESSATVNISRVGQTQLTREMGVS